MPLPRFHRLPVEQQTRILRVAREHFAEVGAEAASYNKIIDAAGISKTSAYQYFDGKADLLAAVLEELRERLLGMVGPWRHAETAGQFWRQFDDGGRRLIHHLSQYPHDRALAESAMAAAGADYLGDWLTAVVDNGLAIGLIRDDVDRTLMLAATAAVINAADRWLIETVGSSSGKAPEAQLRELLTGLWSSPTQ